MQSVTIHQFVNPWTALQRVCNCCAKVQQSNAARFIPTRQPRTKTMRHSIPSGANDSVKQLPAQRLLQFYCEVQHPAYSNRRYSLAMQDFVNEAILAYECGMNEAELQRQLLEVLEQQGLDTDTTSTLSKSMADFSQAEFMQCVSLVWVTLMYSPKSVKRWAHSPAVSDSTAALWQGFVSMIVTGYFERRMAWYPLDRLQLELATVQGQYLNQEVVAERARITFTTLEKLYPQFPSD